MDSYSCNGNTSDSDEDEFPKPIVIVQIDIHQFDKAVKIPLRNRANHSFRLKNLHMCDHVPNIKRSRWDQQDSQISIRQFHEEYK
jgi:hypothetical protein